jgi:hypothetical protein
MECFEVMNRMWFSVKRKGVVTLCKAEILGVQFCKDRKK